MVERIREYLKNFTDPFDKPPAGLSIKAIPSGSLPENQNRLSIKLTTGSIDLNRLIKTLRKNGIHPRKTANGFSLAIGKETDPNCIQIHRREVLLPLDEIHGIPIIRHIGNHIRKR